MLHCRRAFTLAATLALLTHTPLLANDLRIETRTAARAAGARTVQVQASVTWKNAWRTARNHDAVWMVVKLKSRARPNWIHARLVQASAAGASPMGACTVTSDRIGVFCAPAGTHRGDVSWQVMLEVEPGNLPEADLAAGNFDARVIGLEMVYIPEGPFTIGDPDTTLLGSAMFYKSDAAGKYAGTLRITSEDAIDIGPRAGALYYQSANQYQGDRSGPLPAAFPKGTRAFYTMKYEILQGDYATFLNTIPTDMTYFRSPMGGRTYYSERGTIRLVDGQYVAGSPFRPANWVSWDDGAAFADFMGLRPMTEFEFTKAARGPREPIANEYVWGTASKARLLRKMGMDDELVRSGEADESKLTDATRDVLGASHWWVMDLNGSVWEKVVTIGHPRGRAFRGTHGDGVLGGYGIATNEDWPLGDHEAGGFGYRGGGYYARGSAETDLNPYSRVAQRPFGSWGGGPRSIAYGFRAVRTADLPVR